MSYHKFKEGECIRCIEDRDSKYLTEGEIYTVQRMEEGIVRMIDDSGRLKGYWGWRFEPARLSNEERIKRRMEEV